MSLEGIFLAVSSCTEQLLGLAKVSIENGPARNEIEDVTRLLAKAEVLLATKRWKALAELCQRQPSMARWRARKALAAMAASTALPPALRTSSAICVASGWLVAAIPLRAITSERDANGRPELRSYPGIESATALPPVIKIARLVSKTLNFMVVFSIPGKGAHNA